MLWIDPPVESFLSGVGTTLRACRKSEFPSDPAFTCRYAPMPTAPAFGDDLVVADLVFPTASVAVVACTTFVVSFVVVVTVEELLPRPLVGFFTFVVDNTEENIATLPTPMAKIAKIDTVRERLAAKVLAGF